MKIGAVAKKFSITIETLRYWERIGVIPTVDKDPSGQRNYNEEDLNWIKFAMMMRRSGVNINNLQEYIKLFQIGPETRAARKAILENQLALVDEQLAKLNESHKALQWKITHYNQIDENYHGKLRKC